MPPTHEAFEGRDLTKEQRENVSTAEEYGFKGLDARQTTFGDNFEATFFETIAEDLTISKYMNTSAHREQITRLRGMANTGEIPEGVMSKFSGPRPDRYDWAGLGDYVNSTGNDSILTRQQLDDNMKSGLDAVRNQYEDISGRAGIAGQIGGFTGGMAASILDPANIAAVPGKAVTAVSLAGRMAQRFTTGATQAAVIEPVVQGLTHSWKQEIGQEYGMAEILMNSGMSILAGGTLSTGAGTLAEVVKGGFGKARGTVRSGVEALKTREAELNKVADEAVEKGDSQVLEVAEDALEGTEQVRHELENSPVEDVIEHEAGMKAAMEAMDDTITNPFHEDWVDDFDVEAALGPVAEPKAMEPDVETKAKEAADPVKVAPMPDKPKEPAFREPKRRSNEDEDDYFLRQLDAEDAYEAKVTEYEAELADFEAKTRIAAEARAEVDDLEVKEAKLAPLSGDASDTAARAYEVLESNRHGDDAELAAQAEMVASELEGTKALIEKSKLFAECMR